VPRPIPQATYGPGGAKAEVSFEFRTSPLGRILVGATEAGVCSVLLGDEDEELAVGLQRALPRAWVFPAAGGKVGEWADAISALLGPHGRLVQEPPLDVLGTPFQRRVWSILRGIPWGETRSYQEIAVAIDQPAAYRAVANACGANPVALLIPCHRAVRQDGGLGGFACGVERKRWLLGHEAENS